jgi:serine/threonine protein kinase
MASIFERLTQALPPQYVLQRQIAEGGMGIVFEGRHATLQSRVAVKVLRPELATAAMEARFLREARLLAKLSDPSIVNIHDADIADGIHYYVMDFIDGETVAVRLERGPMDPDEVLRLARDILRALSAVHDLGVVHRDIKPSNIFLVDGRSILVDFGIAHVDTTVSDATEPGRAPMTPAYAAPEQRLGLPVTPRTDLYAVGMVLYECVTGTKWSATHDSTDGNWVSVPRPLARPLRKALRHDPKDRWASAKDFRAALNPSRHYAIPKGRALLAATLTLLALVLWFLLTRPRDLGEVDLVINDFDVIGAAPVDGRLLADLVRQRLQPIPNLTLGRGGDSGDPIAQRFLTGTLTPEDDGWALSGSYVDAVGVVSHVYRFVSSNPSPRSLVDSASLEVVRFYFEEFLDRVELPSNNLEALGEWFRGEIAFQQDRWSQSERHFGEALRHDPTFALAAWRRYNARQWGRRPTRIDLDSLYQATLSDGATFTRLDDLLIRAELEPQLETRLLLYDSAATIAGRDYYAALHRGNELFHRGPLAGRPLQESLRALAEAQARDTLLAPAYNQTLWGAIRLGLDTLALVTLQQRQSLGTVASVDDIDAGQLFAWAFLERFHPDLAGPRRDEVFQNPTGPMAVQVARLFRLAPSLDIPQTAIVLGNWIATEPSFEDHERRDALLGAGLASIMVGRPLYGLARMDSSRSPTNDGELLAREARLLLPSFGIAIPEDQQRDARTALANLSRDRQDGARAAWALALDALHRNDTPEFREWRGMLEDHVTRNPRDSALGNVLDILDLGRTDLQSAVAQSQAFTAVDSAGRGVDPFARALLYWRRAEWLQELGQWNDAERTWLWYENSDFGPWPTGPVQPAEIDWMLGSYARVHRARALVTLGRVSEACRHLARVEELWDAAEPQLDSLLTEIDSMQEAECRP